MENCKECNGKGEYLSGKTCPVCNGKGRLTTKETKGYEKEKEERAEQYNRRWRHE